MRPITLSLFAACLSVTAALSVAWPVVAGEPALQTGSRAASVAVSDLERLKALADKGDATAQTDLGLLYRRGQGVSKDPTEALRLFNLAARQGDSRAEGMLAELYYLGEGAPRDLAEAVRRARAAADKGDPSGEVVLGACYAGGVGGLPRDDEEALRLYKLSAEQNNAMAQLLLGGFYEKGRVVAKDAAEAMRLYGLSAGQGMPQARTALARVAASGAAAAPVRPKNLLEISLQREGGVLVVPVTLGGVLHTGFVVDSGASDVVVPQSMADRLRQAGQLDDSDFTGEETHKMADGSTVHVRTFNLRTLQVGDRVLEKVRASLTQAQGLPLLGQTFLQRFDSWSIDNGRRVLILKTSP